MGEQHYNRCKCSRCSSINNAVRKGCNEHGCSFGKVVNTCCYMPHGQYTYDIKKDRLRINPAADYTKTAWDPLEMLHIKICRCH